MPKIIITDTELKNLIRESIMESINNYANQSAAQSTINDTFTIDLRNSKERDIRKIEKNIAASVRQIADNLLNKIQATPRKIVVNYVYDGEFSSQLVLYAIRQNGFERKLTVNGEVISSGRSHTSLAESTIEEMTFHVKTKLYQYIEAKSK